MNRERAHVLALLAIAAIVIGWGIWRIPPHQLNGDEWSAVAKSLLLLFHEPVMPRFRKGGNFHLRLLATAILPLIGYWAVTGRLETMNDESVIYASDVPLDPGPLLEGYYQALLAGRVVSVLAAVGTVYLVYRITSEAAGHRAGVLAGLFLVAAPGFVTISKFATEDAPQFFLVALTLYLLVRAVGEGSERTLMLAAVTFGLAASMKATSGLLLVPMVLAGYTVERRRNGSARHLIESASLYATLAAIGYVATTPSMLFYPEEWFLQVASYTGLSLTTAPLQSPGVTYREPTALLATAHYALSLGAFLTIASLIAVVVLLWGVYRQRYDRRLVLVLAFAIPYALVLFAPRMPQYPRLILLHVPASIAFGVVVSDGFSIAARTPRPGNLVAGWLAVLASVVLVTTAISTGAFIADFGTSRAEATDWLAENAEPGDTVDAYGYRVYVPEAPAGVHVNRPLINDPTRPDVARDAAQRVEQRCPKYVVLSSYYYGRFLHQPWKYPTSTALTTALLSGETGYDRAAQFGPPVTMDYSLTARFERSLDYPPIWLWGDANPTIVIYERAEPMRGYCR